MHALRSPTPTAVFGLLLAGSTLASVAAQTVRAPVLTPGDSWTYVDSRQVGTVQRTSHDTLVLTRADAELVAIAVRPAGSNVAPQERLLGPNWSVVRSVNGKQTVVNQPLAFPLAPGKTWTLAYTDFSPANRTHVREQFAMTYRALGWEDVTVPAGTFHAIKIVGDGTWAADLPGGVTVARGRAPNGAAVETTTRQPPSTASGRYLKTFWYVPEVRRWVKSEESTFNAVGMRIERIGADLEAFAHGDGHVPPMPAPMPPRAPGGAGASQPSGVPRPIPMRPGGARLQQIAW